MLKTLFTATIILFIAGQLYAQKKANTYFLTDKGQEVKNRDSADYIRIIEEPDSGSSFFNLKEYYKDGAKKTLGTVSSFQPYLVYEGNLTRFNRKGIKIKETNFVKSTLSGLENIFFENGKLKSQEYWAVVKKIVFKGDSLGNVFVKDGNGHLIDSTKIEKDILIEEGDFKDSLKNGVWKGRYTCDSSHYREIYANGKLISGENYVGDSTYRYALAEIQPTLKGGIEGWYRYISRSLKYPKDANKNHVQGKVLVEFIIEKDGSINEIKVVKSLYPSIDEEAVRVISQSPKWIPGIQRGRPVRVKYNMPISFAISR